MRVFFDLEAILEKTGWVEGSEVILGEIWKRVLTDACSIAQLLTIQMQVQYFKKRRVMEYQKAKTLQKLAAEGAQELPPGVGPMPPVGPR